MDADIATGQAQNELKLTLMGDYLTPSMQGYRLVSDEYRPIRLKDGRLPSRVLGLHLERSGVDLRLWNPATEHWLPTDSERAETERERAENAEAEVDRLRSLLARRKPHANGTNGT